MSNLASPFLAVYWTYTNASSLVLSVVSCFLREVTKRKKKSVGGERGREGMKEGKEGERDGRKKRKIGEEKREMKRNREEERKGRRWMRFTHFFSIIYSF